MQLSGLAQLIVITMQTLFEQLIVNLKLFSSTYVQLSCILLRFLTVVVFLHGVFCLLKVLLILIGATASITFKVSSWNDPAVRQPTLRS